MTNTNGPAVSATSLIWAIALMFVAVLAAAVTVAVALPETSATTLVGALLAAFALLVTNLGTLFKLGKVEEKVDNAKADTQAIKEQTNGNLDRRIRELSYNSMRKALTDHLEDEDESGSTGAGSTGGGVNSPLRSV